MTKLAKVTLTFSEGQKVPAQSDRAPMASHLLGKMRQLFLRVPSRVPAPPPAEDAPLTREEAAALVALIQGTQAQVASRGVSSIPQAELSPENVARPTTCQRLYCCCSSRK